MPAPIVDVLEAIQIQKQSPDLLQVTLCKGDRLANPIVERFFALAIRSEKSCRGARHDRQVRLLHAFLVRHLVEKTSVPWIALD